MKFNVQSQTWVTLPPSETPGLKSRAGSRGQGTTVVDPVPSHPPRGRFPTGPVAPTQCPVPPGPAGVPAGSRVGRSSVPPLSDPHPPVVPALPASCLFPVVPVSYTPVSRTPSVQSFHTPRVRSHGAPPPTHPGTHRTARGVPSCPLQLWWPALSFFSLLSLLFSLFFSSLFSSLPFSLSLILFLLSFSFLS